MQRISTMATKPEAQAPQTPSQAQITKPAGVPLGDRVKNLVVRGLLDAKMTDADRAALAESLEASAAIVRAFK